ncbi:MAG: alpha-glucan family phosphorylase [Ignavibacteriaceae bacterium]|nr:alpha-glucan family phosphorylase [Ignavibacteriaceae bacterium]
MYEILNQLKEISYNLYWTWNNDVYEIFREINDEYWRWTERNPVKFLETIDENYLYEMIEKKNLKEKIRNSYIQYKKYLKEKTYFQTHYFKTEKPLIAYFSAEFGITKCLKLYSGGLGVLSGDHIKSSSDLGLPLVGIGLAYLYGYFTQYINSDGRQSELFEPNRFEKLPIHRVTDEDFSPIKISIELPGRTVYAQIWEFRVGRVKLFMLDTFVDENTVNDKRITDILYGGNIEKRIEQEILLGIGGKKLLDILNYDIKAFHLNEGHSAFLCLERIKNSIEKYNISFNEAKQLCYYSNIFTTHTPVPAGIDIFSRKLMTHYFESYAQNHLKISFDEFFNEGSLAGTKVNKEQFNMACLAINNSHFLNGVSKLHAETARKMWALPDNRSQIESITNGIHTKSYLSYISERVYRKNFGVDWLKHENIWEKISELPDEILWRMRNDNRRQLIKFTRKRTSNKLKTLKATDDEIQDALHILNENALTIGFARRFATYKRGNFIFTNVARLKSLVLNSERPVQFIFSGKAHPMDEGGKNFIEEINRWTKDPELHGKIVFIDNYELDVAKELVKGCDIWLNTPRRPLEASGTSGMKVLANGGLNFSILDGWWAEAYREENGWKIDTISEDMMTDIAERDLFEANSMYDVLEHLIVPCFYERDQRGIPTAWVKKIRSSIRNLAGYFTTWRMVKEYNEKFYTKVS